MDINFSQQQPNMNPNQFQISSHGFIKPNLPDRSNVIECDVCKANKEVDNFNILYPGHKVCDICRIKNMQQCIICQRYYWRNDKEMLDIISISFNN
ncbi:unnamed protein product [Blepharisma stoltei]|uniref:Uncharacterized protein n=1 Tax=Blepharisma stoltei TaxID=1481888 RepID=A0AAU9IQS5_9CILI|nr:unnamed protein product [Blepharisma stoltei]